MNIRNTTYSFGLNFILLLNRLALGLYFFFAGIHKIQGGFTAFYEKGFKPMSPSFLPQDLLKPYGYALPLLETFFGFALVVGLWGRVSSTVLSLMLISFTIALYGVDKLSAGSGPFHSNFILITLAMLLATTGNGAFSVDQWLNKRKRKH